MTLIRFCWVKCWFGSNPCCNLRSTKFLSPAGKATERQTVLRGSTATTDKRWQPLSRWRSTVITPWSSGTRLAKTTEPAARKSRLGASARGCPTSPRSASPPRLLSDAGASAAKSSPTSTCCVPVSVLRTAHGFNSRLGRCNMLPGNLAAYLRSMI